MESSTTAYAIVSGHPLFSGQDFTVTGNTINFREAPPPGSYPSVIFGEPLRSPVRKAGLHWDANGNVRWF
jgi:hypothetical protein